MAYHYLYGINWSINMKIDFEKLISGHKPVLVDFYTKPCKPCKAADPVLETVRESMGSRAKVIKIDVAKAPKYTEKYHIFNIPHLIIFVDGKEYWRHAGMVSAQHLIDLLESAIQSPMIENMAPYMLRYDLEDQEDD